MRDDKTTMGGPEERFQTTYWTEILNARTLNETRRKDTVNELIRKYWKPVYCYLRRKGNSNEVAKDITQGFFHEIVLGRELIPRADQTKGRFRTFLVTALNRYASDVYRKETAGKRFPESSIVSLESNDLTNLIKTHSELRPDEVFNQVWASEVLDQVLNDVRENCLSSNKEAHWKVFNAKVIKPILDNAETPLLSEICAEYGIDSERKASDMIYLLKRQFRFAMTRYLRQFVESDSEVDEEFHEILEILSRKRTR